MAYGSGYALGYADAPASIWPTRTVEIEFDAGVWTDVSADVATINTRRGRNRELGSFETGTGMLVLRNETRKYDPEYATGAYYGKLRPNRRVRYQVTYNAVTYPVIVGYIDRITQRSGGPNDATTEISFSDLFKVLNRVELPRSVYTAVVANDSPALWYRLDEATGATVAVNSGALGRDYDAVYSAEAAQHLGESSLVVRDEGTSLQVIGWATADPAVTLPPTWSANSALAVEFWVTVTNPGEAGTIIFSLMRPDGTPGAYDVRLVATGKIQFIIYNTAGTPYGVQTTSALTVGVTYHVVATVGADRQMRIWLNGVEAWVADLGVPGVTTGSYFGDRGFLGTGTGSSDILLSDVAVYVGGMSTLLVGLHNSAGRTPWNGDLPGPRAARILDLAAVPAGDRNLDAGTTTLQATSLGGTALAYLQKIEATELGEVFVTRDGKVRLIGRQAAVTGTYLTSQATLADATPAGGEVGYLDVAYDVDDDSLITRATVSRDGSIAVTYYDAVAKAEFGWLDFTADGLLHNSDTYSADYATWIVNTHKTPLSRAGTIAVALAEDPTVRYPKILGLEIGDRVTVKRRPKVGAAITSDMRVEAIAHATAASVYGVTLQLSPFNPGEGGWPVGVWDSTLWDQSVWGL